MSMATKAPWAAEHAALIVSAEFDSGRTVHASHAGTMIGGELLEAWLVLMPLWRMVRPTGTLRGLVQWLQERRVALEHAWSRATRFLPRAAMRLVGDGILVQSVDGWGLVRTDAGGHIWRQAPESLAPLRPPEEAVFHDAQCSTASNKQAFRRNMVAAPSRLEELLGDTQEMSRKRKREPEEPSQVQCTVVGPFAPWCVRNALTVFDTPGVLALHDVVRFYPTPGNDLFAVAFVRTAEAQDALLTALEQTQLPYSELADDVLARPVTGVECDITLTVDSLDFAATSLRREYDAAGFAERATMQPKRATSRFVPLQLLYETTPYTWEALAAVDQPGRRPIGIERALSGQYPDRFDASLHVPHKASVELAEQMFDACMWLGHADTVPEKGRALQILRQAVFDGFYLRTIA